MSEYKRLTERDEYGNADIIGLSTEKLFGELYFDEINLLTKALNKLAFLEDKIENGTLIELPCKVGDTVYQFDNAGNIYESKIKQLIYDTGHISFDERAIGTSIFLTKAEVEARLKELQEKEECR